MMTLIAKSPLRSAFSLEHHFLKCPKSYLSLQSLKPTYIDLCFFLSLYAKFRWFSTTCTTLSSKLWRKLEAFPHPYHRRLTNKQTFVNRQLCLTFTISVYMKKKSSICLQKSVHNKKTCHEMTLDHLT